MHDLTFLSNFSFMDCAVCIVQGETWRRKRISKKSARSARVGILGKETTSKNVQDIIVRNNICKSTDQVVIVGYVVMIT